MLSSFGSRVGPKHEGDARLGGDVGEVKLRLRWGIAGAGRATVQDDDERDVGQERNADDALAPHWARKSHGVNDITGRVGYTRSEERRVGKEGRSRGSVEASKERARE